jgi:hypothetical protein
VKTDRGGGGMAAPPSSITVGGGLPAVPRPDVGRLAVGQRRLEDVVLLRNLGVAQVGAPRVRPEGVVGGVDPGVRAYIKL